MLLYDHQTQSLWSQIMRESVTGPLTGKSIATIPVVETTWKDWKRQYADTLVLSLDTGYVRRYMDDPYGIRAKKVLGVIVNHKAKTYPLDRLKKIKELPIRDELAGTPILIYFEKKSQKAWATDSAGKSVESFLVFRQAWETFYPEAEVFEGR